MSEDRSGLVDAMRLAALGSVNEHRVALGEFTRLAGLLAGTEGEARISLGWYREGEATCCRLAIDAQLPLTCQRCQRPYRHALRAEARLALLAVESASCPEGHEPLVLDAGRVDWHALAEDELLLSLPVLPLHPAGSECAGRVAERAGDETAEGAMRRPFAGLRDMLKH